MTIEQVNGEGEKGIKVTIQWETNDAERATFTNHATVNFDGSTYILRFYQVLLPPGIDANNPPHQIAARHVATLAINAGDMPAIAKLLQGEKSE